MVTKIQTDGNGIAKYLCDTIDDIESLPIANPGSIALVATTADVYIVNGQKTWMKFGGGESNGS